MNSQAKWTASYVPDQAGRVAVITGANSGIGYAAAAVLADRGARVVLAVRDPDKGNAAAEAIRAAGPADVAVQRLDLASLDSVRAAAEELRASHPRIDLLINNAGVMYTPKQTTADGFEMQLGTNHLGHFALTGLLLDQLNAAGSRVVTISSLAHNIMAAIHFDDLQWQRGYNRVAAYGQSKLANLLFAYQLHHRLEASNRPTISVAAHPGMSNTELTRNLPAPMRPAERLLAPLLMQSAEMGALPTLRAATDPSAAGGQYYGPGGRGQQRGHPKAVDSNRQSHDRQLQQRLWQVSEELTGVGFPL